MSGALAAASLQRRTGSLQTSFRAIVREAIITRNSPKTAVTTARVETRRLAGHARRRANAAPVAIAKPPPAT